jgi:hypothetical protein
MTQINWDTIPDATDAALRAADMLIVTAPFGAHGARFFINPSEDVTIWDKALFIQRTHSP